MPTATGTPTLAAATLSGAGTRTVAPIGDDKILTIRDALVADINASVKPRSATAFTAQAAYAISDDELLQVLVMAVDEVESISERGADEIVYQIVVLVRKSVDRTNVAEIDPLLNLAKLIGRRYQIETDLSEHSIETASVGQVVLTEKRWFPLFNRYLLENTGYFHTELQLFFREWVDR